MNFIVSDKVACAVCAKKFKSNELLPGAMVRESVASEIRKDHPEWSASSFICRDDLEHYRALYVQHCLEQDKGELSELEAEVLKAIKEQNLLTKNINEEFNTNSTFGQRVADKVAEFGGSWNFIILFAVIIGLWITVNCIALTRRFDPFPFILLNLVLSCVAAMQAPVIMMSQNRQEAKDRLRSEHDYQINLKAELEIKNLSEKMDHLLHQQWQRLLEIQQIQTDLMEDIVSGKHKAPAKQVAVDVEKS